MQGTGTCRGKPLALNSEPTPLREKTRALGHPIKNGHGLAQEIVIGAQELAEQDGGKECA